MSTLQQTAGQQVARRSNTPGTLVAEYSESFQSVLPSHVNPESWVRITQSALKRGRIDRASGMYDLEVAALNNPGKFLSTLLDAARLGLEPGTEEFYLTARKVKGRPEILGIVGYQGLIELIYRAGAVSSVIVEVVRENESFTYTPGRDEIPVHEINWDADDRGSLRLVYAYARMKDGAYSKVVVLNKTRVAQIRAASDGANSEYSPWAKWEESMWMKSAVRQLAKWVPTSAEYRLQEARAEHEARQPLTPQPLPDGSTWQPPSEMAVIDAEVDVTSFEEAPAELFPEEPQ